MKRILLLLGLILITPCVKAEELPNVQLELRGYNSFELQMGTFIPVMSAQEISTQYCSEGYKVKFLATNDLYIGDVNIVPKDTAFYGYIEKINEPVVGTNAAMKIKITKMVYKDGFETPIRGYLYTPNNNIIGGGMSEPVEYVKIAHHQSNIRRTTLQLRPGMQRKVGEHTTVQSGSNGLIILTDAASITHTLTN